MALCSVELMSENGHKPLMETTLLFLQFLTEGALSWGGVKMGEY